MTTEKIVKDAPAGERSCSTCRWFTEAVDTIATFNWCNCYMSPQYAQIGSDKTKPCNLYWPGVPWRWWVPTEKPGGFVLDVNPEHCKTACIYFSKETSRHYDGWSVYDLAPCGGISALCTWPRRASGADIATWRQHREDVEPVKGIEQLGRDHDN